MRKSLFLVILVLTAIISGCIPEEALPSGVNEDLEEVNQVDIGMQKEDFLKLFPETTTYTETGTPIALDFISSFDYGEDCLKINKLAFACFKDNKVFVISGDIPLVGGSAVRLHEDRSSLMGSLDYTSFDTCDNLDDLPYYVGHLDKLKCYEHVGKVTGDPKGCQLFVQQKIAEGNELTKEVYGSFPPEQQYENNCVKKFISETGEVDHCDKVGPPNLRNSCYSMVAMHTGDATFCKEIDVEAAKPNELEKCELNAEGSKKNPGPALVKWREKFGY